jgi:hypothetical protein
MAITFSDQLPFPRGRTLSDAGVATVSDTYYEHLEGRIYSVRDTVHSKGIPIHLIVLKNDTGAAITVARRGVRFSTTDAYDFGRRVAGWVNAAGQVGVPIDDDYSLGFSIPDNDLFYGIVRGYCTINTEATSVDLHKHGAITWEANGYVDGAEAGTGDFIIGTCDETTQLTNHPLRVFVDINLRLPYGSTGT